MSNAKTQAPIMNEIDRVSRITQEQFVRAYMNMNKPVILTDMIDDWPARRNWSFEAFSEMQSDAEVYLEVGNVIQNETIFHPVKFRDYITMIKDSERGGGAQATGVRDEDGVPYLSIFDIFSFFPELKQDVDFSIISSQKLFNHVAAFLGPRGTVTGFHLDWVDNVLAQIYGSKAVIMVSPDQTPGMYPSRKYDMVSTFSSIDPDHYDRKTHPLYEQVKPIHTKLEAGEMLFIPRGWWHHIRSLSSSISVGNFGFDTKALLTDGVRLFSRYLMHQCGAWQECTCHMVKDGKRIKRPVA